MKTLLTLLFVLAAVSSFAQRDAEREEAKRVILGDTRTSYPRTDDDRTVYGSRTERHPSRYANSREQRIYEINREYDARINRVRHNWRLSRHQKARTIRQLEVERRKRIDAVNDAYYSRDRRYNDRYDNRRSKQYKRNNGNHYGWERGKGNPHKGRY